MSGLRSAEHVDFCPDRTHLSHPTLGGYVVVCSLGVGWDYWYCLFCIWSDPVQSVGMTNSLWVCFPVGIWSSASALTLFSHKLSFLRPCPQVLLHGRPLYLRPTLRASLGENIVTWNARYNVTEIHLIYFMYPFGKEPVQNFWKGAAKLGEWSDEPAIDQPYHHACIPSSLLVRVKDTDWILKIKTSWERFLVGSFQNGWFQTWDLSDVSALQGWLPPTPTYRGTWYSRCPSFRKF